MYELWCGLSGTKLEDTLKNKIGRTVWVLKLRIRQGLYVEIEFSGSEILKAAKHALSKQC